MTKAFKGIVLGLLLAGAGSAGADVPGSDWMSREQVIQKLEQAGFTRVTQLEADDGHWEGEAWKDGRLMEFHVDPRSGAITKAEPKD